MVRRTCCWEIWRHLRNLSLNRKRQCVGIVNLWWYLRCARMHWTSDAQLSKVSLKQTLWNELICSGLQWNCVLKATSQSRCEAGTYSGFVQLSWCMCPDVLNCARETREGVLMNYDETRAEGLKGNARRSFCLGELWWRCGYWCCANCACFEEFTMKRSGSEQVFRLFIEPVEVVLRKVEGILYWFSKSFCSPHIKIVVK